MQGFAYHPCSDFALLCFLDSYCYKVTDTKRSAGLVDALHEASSRIISHAQSAAIADHIVDGILHSISIATLCLRNPTLVLPALY